MCMQVSASCALVCRQRALLPERVTIEPHFLGATGHPAGQQMRTAIGPASAFIGEKVTDSIRSAIVDRLIGFDRITAGGARDTGTSPTATPGSRDGDFTP